VFVPRAARSNSGRTDLAHVGPLTVARGSSLPLKIGFGVVLAMVIGLAIAVAALWTKIAKMKRDQEAKPGPSR